MNRPLYKAKIINHWKLIFASRNSGPRMFAYDKTKEFQNLDFKMYYINYNK